MKIIDILLRFMLFAIGVAFLALGASCFLETREPVVTMPVPEPTTSSESTAAESSESGESEETATTAAHNGQEMICKQCTMCADIGLPNPQCYQSMLCCTNEPFAEIDCDPCPGGH